MYKNKKNSLYCKYCKKTDHLIDTCTSILCKICNKSGHPHWNCKNSAPAKNINNKQPSLQKNKISTDFNTFNVKIEVSDPINKIDNNISKLSGKSLSALDNFNSVSSQSPPISNKNSLNYYIQFKDSKWSSLL